MNSELLKEPILKYWLNHPVSELSHHRSDCCDTAQRHFLSSYVGRARLYSCGPWSDSLLALLDDFKWGWSPWPLYWCMLREHDHLDCGAFAALAREILRQLDVANYPVQVIQRFPVTEIQHFKKLWERKDDSPLWLGQNHAYHELCLVENGVGLPSVLFDPSFGTIVEDITSESFGGIVALRAQLTQPVSWAGYTLQGTDWRFFL